MQDIYRIAAIEGLAATSSRGRAADRRGAFDCSFAVRRTVMSKGIEPKAAV
jgi:hypothetical protein